MSQRYEITPGSGLVARHGDSLVWVGPDLAPEAWDALGAVLDLAPGSDPSGAETAAALASLADVLREHPATTFASLVISDGQAQGILRGPVTVCNATAVAPATGYEQFSVTVPFPMSEAVYVGQLQASANIPSIAQLFDLDAGVVPGGGAWIHPITSGHRYASSGSGVHASVITGQTAVPETSASAADVSDVLSNDAVVSEEPAHEAAPASPASELTDEASESAPSAGDNPSAGIASAAGGVSSAGQARLVVGGALAAGAAAAGISGALHPDTSASDESDRHTETPRSAHPDSPAQQPKAGQPAADQPVDVPDIESPLPDELAQHSGAAAGDQSSGQEQPQQSAEASSNDLPSLSAPPSPWAVPGVTVQGETTDVAGETAGFTPAADHLRIDLRNAPATATATALPLIPTQASGSPTTARRAGVLVFDDGSTFALDHDYVIGRRPERHGLVQSGKARPLTIVDPDTVLSGAHAALRLHQGETYLEDLGSLNGSHIAPPGATDWIRVESYSPVRLEPGTRLLFGWTVATYSGANDQS